MQQLAEVQWNFKSKMSFFYNFILGKKNNFVLKSINLFDMGKIISFVLSASLIIACCLFATIKTFSQTSETVDNTATTETKKSNLFNEGGYVRGVTPARVIGLTEVLLSILSIVIAVRAKKRSSITGTKTALTLGLLAIVFSILHFITTAGAVFGSGSGKAGAILAILLSLIGIILSGLALRQKKI